MRRVDVRQVWVVVHHHQVGIITTITRILL